jgi:ribonuclease III
VIREAETDELKSWVERSFGHGLKHAALFQVAVTHRSAGGEHNERLEFLGDSVLNCAVARLLYDAHPGADEGALSRLRATLVSGESLAQLASDLGLGAHLRLGPGELKSGGYRRASILADALEALVGAIFVEAGFDAAAAAVKHVVGRRLDELPTAEALKDPKTRLQEALQARGLALPVYALTAASGDPHAQLFTVTCEVPTFGLAAVGKGGSRRSAEQSAARKLLDLLPGEMGKFS